jgi:5S rRNA maturation endonuclease (ribonuclease M5)
MPKEIVDILLDLGYNPVRDNNGWRMSRVYAEGDNPTALWISNDGFCCDFVADEKFNFEELVRRTLNLPDTKTTQEWLKTNEFIKPCKSLQPPKIKMKKVFSADSLNKLIADHSYWINRGISQQTLEVFKGGVSLSGGSKDRYVFPVWDSKKDLIGFAARDTTNTKAAKWKLFGEKTLFVWPALVNYNIIKETKRVILVESIGDALALWECGIKNVIVTFGTALSNKIVNFIIHVDPKEIIISTNNDEQFRGNAAGNEAALKMHEKLCKYMERRKVKILLPDLEKDWNDQLIKHGKDSVRKRFL